MTQLSFVSTAVGAKELISSEFITFKHYLKPKKLGWVKFAIRLALSRRNDTTLSCFHLARCLGTGFKWVYNLYSYFPNRMFGPSVAPDLDRAWILGGFCVLAMTVCAPLVVLSEPITSNIQMLITHLIIVISLSHIRYTYIKRFRSLFPIEHSRTALVSPSDGEWRDYSQNQCKHNVHRPVCIAPNNCGILPQYLRSMPSKQRCRANRGEEAR